MFPRIRVHILVLVYQLLRLLKHFLSYWLTEWVVVLLQLLVFIELVLKVSKVIVYGHGFVVRTAFLATLVPEEIDFGWLIFFFIFQIRNVVKNITGGFILDFLVKIGVVLEIISFKLWVILTSFLGILLNWGFGSGVCGWWGTGSLNLSLLFFSFLLRYNILFRLLNFTFGVFQIRSTSFKFSYFRLLLRWSWWFYLSFLHWLRTEGCNLFDYLGLSWSCNWLNNFALFDFLCHCWSHLVFGRGAFFLIWISLLLVIHESLAL